MGARGPPNDEPRETPLKAWFSDLYTGKSHIDCYHFIQQCEDHFETARATGTNRTSFAATFLSEKISGHKGRHRAVSEIPISWSGFKAFLIKDLGESRSFVDSIWSKFKRDSQYQLEEVPVTASPEALQHVPCIRYPIQFQESQEVRALIDSGSKVNAMTPAYAAG